MTTHTLKSNEINFEVYLTDNGSVFARYFRNVPRTYKITASGEAHLVPIPVELNEEDSEAYWEDFVTLEQIRKIRLLATNFDFSDLIATMNAFISEVDSGTYTFEKFDVRHANILSDYLDVLSQLKEITKEDHFEYKKNEASLFCDEYFFERSLPLDKTDLKKIKTFLLSCIDFLRKNQNN